MRGLVQFTVTTLGLRNSFQVFLEAYRDHCGRFDLNIPHPSADKLAEEKYQKWRKCGGKRTPTIVVNYCRTQLRIYPKEK